MLDNLIVNIRTILPKATVKSTANGSRDDKFNGNYTHDSAIAFLDRSSNRNDAIFNDTANRTMLNAVRSYFSQLYYNKKPASDVDNNDIMLPRVYDYSDLHADWDPVELKVKEKLIEDIDNVIDKFVRVISVNETNSPRRTELFYKRNDREEIRRRLAMGAEDDYLTKISTAKPGRKPSLQTRLQEGKNLQICFVNDAAAAADVDSLSSDSESCPKLSKPITHTNQSTNSVNRLSSSIQPPNPYSSRPLSMKKTTSQEKVRSSVLTLDALKTDEDPKEIDFFTKQARLQIEARMALAQAKDIAHMQMEMERQKQMESPITGMIRNTIEKVGYNFPAEKRRVSRQMLTDMNVAQLQIIVNDFHTQIESLNEQLVKYLMDRDDLHMSQDSMLVDIEDLTRYLGAKKDPYSERKKPTKKYHSMKSPKYMVSHKIQPQHRLASQIGKS